MTLDINSIYSIGVGAFYPLEWTPELEHLGILFGVCDLDNTQYTIYNIQSRWMNEDSVKWVGSWKLEY